MSTAGTTDTAGTADMTGAANTGGGVTFAGWSPGTIEQARRGPTSVNSGWGERIADAGLGSALVIAGLRTRGWHGGAMIATGGVFLYAAATGHFAPMPRWRWCVIASSPAMG